MSNELLQKCKDEYAKENGWEDFDALLNEGFGLPKGIDHSTFDNFAERYAAAVTAALQSENDCLEFDMQSVIDNHVVIEKAFEQMKADVLELREQLRLIYNHSYRDLPPEYKTQGKEVLTKTAHYEQ